MAAKRPIPTRTERPANRLFDKVAENLYRHKSSNTYYALLKRGGKQFRRSLKTTDRVLANRRLADLRRLVGSLAVSDDGKAGFEEVAKSWLETVRHTMKASSALRRETYSGRYGTQTARAIHPRNRDYPYCAQTRP